MKSFIALKSFETLKITHFSFIICSVVMILTPSSKAGNLDKVSRQGAPSRIVKKTPVQPNQGQAKQFRPAKTKKHPVYSPPQANQKSTLNHPVTETQDLEKSSHAGGPLMEPVHSDPISILRDELHSPDLKKVIDEVEPSLRKTLHEFKEVHFNPSEGEIAPERQFIHSAKTILHSCQLKDKSESEQGVEPSFDVDPTIE